MRDFLAARGIVLPQGSRDDAADRATVWGVGNRKNELFRHLLEEQGVEVFPGSIRLVRALRDAGCRTGVVSASENCHAILDAAGITGLFYVVVDGYITEAQHLAGKPAPDTYLYGAQLLGLVPRHVAVVEDAPAGVAAGRAGGFGYVVGVARRASASELFAAGADVVVGDLEEFEVLFELLGRMTYVSRRVSVVGAMPVSALGRERLRPLSGPRRGGVGGMPAEPGGAGSGSS